MKKITEIQDLIKNEEKMHIFVDYNHAAKNLAQLCLSDARESRGLRIIENFAKLPFLKIGVICKNKTPQKEISKLSSKLSDVDFLKYEKEKFNEMCNNIDDKITLLYIGNNEDIINMEKFQKGYTILIDSSKKQSCKTVDFTIGTQEFMDLVLETNNLCL